MSKTTVSTAGGAMPKVDRATLMTRAWAIFRQTYRYPEIKFSDIGRPCFAWALKQAWVETREAARVAALSPAAKAERIETLQILIAHAGYIDCGPQWKATTAPIATKSANCNQPERRSSTRRPPKNWPHEYESSNSLISKSEKSQ